MPPKTLAILALIIVTKSGIVTMKTNYKKFLVYKNVIPAIYMQLHVHAKYQMSRTTGSGGTNFEQKTKRDYSCMTEGSGPPTGYIYIQLHAKCQVSRTTG